MYFWLLMHWGSIHFRLRSFRRESEMDPRLSPMSSSAPKSLFIRNITFAFDFFKMSDSSSLSFDCTSLLPDGQTVGRLIERLSAAAAVDIVFIITIRLLLFFCVLLLLLFRCVCACQNLRKLIKKFKFIRIDRLPLPEESESSSCKIFLGTVESTVGGTHVPSCFPEFWFVAEPSSSSFEPLPDDRLAGRSSASSGVVVGVFSGVRK